MAEDRTAVLLIRVWLEGQDEAFRARLTATGLPSDGALVRENTVAVAASPREVVAAVDDWLAGFLRDAGNGDGENGNG